MPHLIRHSLWFRFFTLFLASTAAFAATSWEYYQAGMRLYNRHEYNQAARYFQAAVQNDPNNWQAYEALGYCDYALGDKEGAKKTINQSLTIHPDNPQLARFGENLQTPLPPSTSSPSSSRAAQNSPVIGGGNFGLGLVVGAPGDWGVSGKYWVDRQNAFQGAVKLLGGGTILQLQYLWHDYDLIRPSTGDFPFYVGAGGDLAIGGGAVAIAGCVPVGISYLFQKKTIPLDLFVEVEPTIWISGGGINFDLYGNLGSRFYF